MPAAWPSWPPTPPCSAGYSGLTWGLTNDRVARAAAGEGGGDAPAAARLGAAAAGPRARAAGLAAGWRRLDLGDVDGRRAGHGHDDLHHGVGPDPDLRPDGRAEFRPWRLHLDRRLCGDAGAAAAGRLERRRFGVAELGRARLGGGRRGARD